MDKAVEGTVENLETIQIPKKSKSIQRKRRATKKRTGRKSNSPKDSRKRISRNFPASSFEETLEFAKAIFKVGSGNPVRRLTLFNELGKSPESSASRQLITNAGKYVICPL